MQPLYLILFVILTIILNVSITLLIPYVKQYWSLIITRISRVFKRKPTVDYSSLEQRIGELEKKVAKRRHNDRQAIRDEIKNVLLELKK